MHFSSSWLLSDAFVFQVVETAEEEPHGETNTTHPPPFLLLSAYMLYSGQSVNRPNGFEIHNRNWLFSGGLVRNQDHLTDCGESMRSEKIHWTQPEPEPEQFNPSNVFSCVLWRWMLIVTEICPLIFFTLEICCNSTFRTDSRKLSHRSVKMNRYWYRYNQRYANLSI